jgi:spermidine/putrescine transport system permease protein
MALARRPVVLASVAWAYFAWSFVPVVVAVAASLGGGPFEENQGLTLDAYAFAFRESEIRSAFVHSVRLGLGTVAIAVPLGTGLGLALARLDGRGWRLLRASLPAAVALPPVALAVILLYLFAFVLPVRLDAWAQLIGHVTIALPFVALIVWTRMLFLDPSYEEQALDLGSSPIAAVGRVLIPLCAPAIVVAAAVAFTLSFNQIVLSQYLCFPTECTTVPMLFGGRAQGDVPPSAFAISVIATLLSLATLAIGVLAVVAARRSRPAADRRARPAPA